MIERFEYNFVVVVIRNPEKRIIRIFHRDFTRMRFRIIRAVFLAYRYRNIILRSAQKGGIYCFVYDFPVVCHEIREIASHDLTIQFHNRRRRFPRFRDLRSVQRQLRILIRQRVFHVLDNLRYAD